MYKLRRLFVLTPILIFLSLQVKGATLTAYIAKSPGNTGCAGSSVSLKDSSDYNGSKSLSYKWYFGDGSTATGSTTQSKTYASAGTYTVSLVVESTSESLKDSTTKTITIYGKPPVSFTITGDLCVGAELQFKNTTTLPSGTSISSVLWKWGNGNSSTLITSTNIYIYNTAATYNVVLYVTTDKGCTDSLQKTIIINPKPTGVMDVIARCEDSSSVLDAGNSTGPVGGYKWTFPDGSTATGKTVVKNFGGPGSYLVKLEVINSGAGCNDSVFRSVIVGDNPNIKTWFKNTCNDSVLTVLDSSSSKFGALASWEWSWGDGSSNTKYTTKKDSVVHPYATPGTYTVTLTLKTIKGCTSKYTGQVEMYPLPAAKFNFKNTCADSGVTFTDASTATGKGKTTSWFWYFGDSTNGAPSTSAVQNPTHVYKQPGTYYVSQVAYSAYGCKDSTSAKITIYEKPTAKFSFTSKCENEVVDFTDFSTVPGDTAVAWYWNFGDGKATTTTKDAKHVFDTSGVYIVKHVAFSKIGCSDTASVEVNIYEPPVPNFYVQKNCERDTVLFFDTSTIIAPFTIVDWQWNFGDGKGAAGKTTNHVYAKAGAYSVVLTVTSDKGCSKSISKNINIVEAPVAQFLNTPTCIGRQTEFTSTATYNGAITQYIWDFGDGSALATGKNVTHTFPAKGVYYVKHTTVSDIGCKDAFTKQVSVSDVPKAGFAFKNTCNDSAVVFNDTSSIDAGSIVSWSWDYGDGATGSGQKPTHLYPAPGQYNVKLVVTSSTGCQDSVTRQVTTYANPTSDFTFITHCRDSAVEFFDQSIMPSGGAGGWFWDFGDGKTSTKRNPTNKYIIGGGYNVKLTAFSIYGCQNEKIIPIQVYPLPKVDFFASEACVRQPFSFFNNSSVTTGSIASYLWDFGDGQTSTDKDPVHNYLDSGIYTVRMIVTTDKGCKDSVSKNIEVFPLPEVNFYYTGSCIGDFYNFYDSSTVKGGIDRWTWDFGDGGKRSSQNPAYKFADTGVYIVTLIAYSEQGCSDTIRKQVRVYPLPVAGFKSDIACEGTETIFEDISTLNVGAIGERRWNFGDGTFLKTTQPIVSHKYPDGGTYNVTLQVFSDQGCSDSFTSTASVLQAPQAKFVYDPDPATIINPVVSFRDTSAGAPVKWYWDFGDGLEDSVRHPVHRYSDTGEYIVTFAVRNSMGCDDTLIYTLRIHDKYTLFAPNIITVNDDELNDEWMAKGDGIKLFQVFIYDRWGVEVFHSTDINEPWKGEYNNNGVKVPEGAYVYYIKLVEYSNVEWKTKHGSIIVTR